jgi:RNA polymerase sigma factor for flagellar operon FliA
MVKEYKNYSGDPPSPGGSTDLVLEHIGLVQRIAMHLKARLPDYVELEELVQIGMIGLLEAFKSFDESQGDDLASFATKRIRGAILDEVRRRSPLSRQDNIHAKTREAIIDDHLARTGRRPSAVEISSEMGVTLEDYHRSEMKTHIYQLSSYEVLTENGFEQAHDADSPDEEIEHSQTLGILETRIGQLEQRDQLILSLYYEKELNLKEIGSILNISESRVSQLLTKIVTQLRAEVRL